MYPSVSDVHIGCHDYIVIRIHRRDLGMQSFRYLLAVDVETQDFEENTQRLVDGRQSIVKAAQEVIDAGVKLTPGKVLPESAE